MNKTDKHIIHVLRVGGVILLCCFIAFTYLFVADILYENTANKYWQSSRYQKRKDNPYNIAAVDSSIQLLTTSDLVVRRGDDMTSYMLSKLNTVDKRYSHCGIASIENGTVYIYHSIGGEDNPDAQLRKDKAEFWFSPANNTAFGIYRFKVPDSAKIAFVGAVENFYQNKLMFDMEFDMKTDDRMYCSEMIYKALKNGMGGQSFMKLGTRQGRSYIAVDDLYRNEQTMLVCQIEFK